MKHKRPDFMLQYFSVLKILIKLANLYTIDAIEKIIFDKIVDKVKKE